MRLIEIVCWDCSSGSFIGIGSRDRSFPIDRRLIRCSIAEDHGIVTTMLMFLFSAMYVSLNWFECFSFSIIEERSRVACDNIGQSVIV